MMLPFSMRQTTTTTVARRAAVSPLATPSSLISQSPASSSSSSPSISAFNTPLLPTTTTALRYQSTYRRTKKRLRMKPDATFGAFPSSSSSSSSSPAPLSSSLLEHLHLIHNPPSSAPNVLHTPTKFLPPSDLRLHLRRAKQAQEQEQQQGSAGGAEQSGSAAGGDDATKLPLLFPHSTGPADASRHKPAHQHATLDRAAILEMRRLRARDPIRWSRQALARKFKCSPLFVGQVCEASPEKKEMQRKLLEAVRATWGKKRAGAREERAIRKEAWGSDQ